MTEWLAGFDDLAGAEIAIASSDASFRRYFRVTTAAGSRIVMDAPPAREDCRPFVRVAGYLERMGLNSPRVLQADFERGFLLLTDLGSTLYLDALRRNPRDADALYRDAMRALRTLQAEGMRLKDGLPPYDRKLLEFELSLFHDWLCGRHLDIALSDADEQAWQACCDHLVISALHQPTVFVHRDYHSRNLLVTDVDNPGVLDFQDAVNGPLTYDLVSLLRDCYVRWPARQVHDWAMSFFASLDASITGDLDAAAFYRYFELMGVQRHLKAAGIFARLLHRDGKSSYLRDVPRTLEYVAEVAGRYDELAFIARLVEGECLPRLRERS
jgi:aminoglycoside/choline kinase family phosphotransferase